MAERDSIENEPEEENEAEIQLDEWDDLDELSPRPGFCRSGKRIEIRANHFTMEVGITSVYHYDLDIFSLFRKTERRYPHDDGNELKSYSSKVNRKVFDEASRKWRLFQNIVPVYDGRKNVFTKTRLKMKDNSDEFTLERENSNDYRLIIKPVKKKNGDCLIDFGPIKNISNPSFHFNESLKEALMALGIILRHAPSLAYVPIGRGFFSREMGVRGIAGNLELWKGFKQSVGLGRNRLLLNIDVANKIFYPAVPLLEHAGRILRKHPLRNIHLQDKEYTLLNNELAGLEFSVRHLAGRAEKSYKISQLHRGNSRETIIDGLEMSVEQYYKKTHRITLRYPLLPLVNAGTEQRPKYYPLELCFIKENQPCKRSLSDAQTSDRVKYTVTDPGQRFDEVREILLRMNDLLESKCIKSEYQIVISMEPILIKAKELEAPKIQYLLGNRRETSVSPKDGTWRAVGKKFLQPVTMKKWAILSFCKRTNFCHCRHECDCDLAVFDNFAKNIISTGSRYGMKIYKPCAINRTSSPTHYDDLRKLKNVNPDLQLIYVIFDPRYTWKSEIKLIGDKELNIPTLCIKESNIRSEKVSKNQFAINICQKINAKLGGVNSCLDPSKKPEILNEPVILMGADVNHAPFMSDMPSVAAVVGSIDESYSQYCASVRVQRETETKQRIEIIEKIEEMTREILKSYLEMNDDDQDFSKPPKIIFYRDGVGDGQFAKVKREELALIKKACKEVIGQELPITFVIVSKRHSTRFEMINPSCSAEGQNVPPGTVVDQDILEPLKFEFFLCSHAEIRGTSRPIKYSVLHDENHLPPDELAKLTYYSCHLYARCTRSISIPTPVLYAHKAAYRGKEYLEAALSVDDDEEEEDDEDPDEDFNMKKAINITDGMFFF